MGQIVGMALSILLAVAVLAAIAAAAFLAGVWWLRRMWRRRKVAIALRVNGLVVGAAAAGVQWLRTRPRPDHRFWVLQRARHDLLRAFGWAEHAVREAKAANVATGDLEGLTRRLRRSVLDVDRSLRIAQRSGGTEPIEELLEHAGELTTSAVRIQRAAAASLTDLHRATTVELVSHIRREEEAITTRAHR